MFFWQLSSSYTYAEQAAKTTFVQKTRPKNVDEIAGLRGWRSKAGNNNIMTIIISAWQ